MRFRTTVGLVAVAAACMMLSAWAAFASPDRTTIGPVHLHVTHSSLRAGETVPVTVINTGPTEILRALQFTLEHHVTSGWVIVRTTHGVSVWSRQVAGVPEAAHASQTVGLPLYDDLTPGSYRIMLPYKPVAGSDLGNLTGPQVRSVTTGFTVLAFKPGAQPTISEARIRSIATQAAIANGDPRPLLIQHATGTRFLAVLVSSGDLVFAWNWSVLIAIRGQFVTPNPSIAPGARPLRGTVLTLVINAATDQITDSGVSNRYPHLARLGPVATDLGTPP